MILYFSATGNSEFVAKEIASRLDDTALNLLERIKNHDYSTLFSDKPFLVVSPVYACQIPFFLRDFLIKTTFSGNNCVYGILTSGGYAGMSGAQMKRVFRKKHMEWMGRAEVRMPRNYIASNKYSSLTDEEIEERLLSAAESLDSIVEIIKTGKKLVARHIQLWEKFVIPPVAAFWRRFMQSTKPFVATDKCIGCGKCELLCPLNHIRLSDNKRPEWDGKQCAHCMACIQNCPVSAIEYGNITPKKDRYTFFRYKSCVGK